MARESKFFAVEVEFGKDGKVIVRVPFLESGIDSRYIQELLGHKGSKTAETYSHVSTKNLTAIKNLIDTLSAECGI